MKSPGPKKLDAIPAHARRLLILFLERVNEQKDNYLQKRLVPPTDIPIDTLTGNGLSSETVIEMVELLQDLHHILLDKEKAPELMKIANPPPHIRESSEGTIVRFLGIYPTQKLQRELQKLQERKEPEQVSLHIDLKRAIIYRPEEPTATCEIPKNTARLLEELRKIPAIKQLELAARMNIDTPNITKSKSDLNRKLRSALGLSANLIERNAAVGYYLNKNQFHISW